MIEGLHIQRDTVAGKLLVAAKLNVRFKSLPEEESHVGGTPSENGGVSTDRGTQLWSCGCKSTTIPTIIKRDQMDGSTSSKGSTMSDFLISIVF